MRNIRKPPIANPHEHSNRSKRRHERDVGKSGADRPTIGRTEVVIVSRNREVVEPSRSMGDANRPMHVNNIDDQPEAMPSRGVAG